MSVNSIPHNRFAWRQPISEKLDGFRLQFQGSLVKVSRLPIQGWVEDRDNDRLEKQVRREIVDAARSGGISLDRLIVDEFGSIQGVKMTPELRSWLYRRASEKLVAASGSKRGKIGGFSAKSRKRLLEWLSRLKSDVTGLFITLTYRQNMQDYKLAKKHLDLTLRWIKRVAPGRAIFWRMEEQERGAIHFHLIVLQATFIKAADITDFWQTLTGDDSYPDVKRIRNRRQALHYAAKYVSKVSEANNGFIPLPYSEIEDLDASWRGRFWGIVNRACLPLADLTEIVFRGRLLPLLDFRRAASRKSRFVRRPGRVVGFTLFTGAAGWWLRLWNFYQEQYSGGIAPPGYKRLKRSPGMVNIGSGYRDMLAAAQLLA